MAWEKWQESSKVKTPHYITNWPSITELHYITELGKSQGNESITT